MRESVLDAVQTPEVELSQQELLSSLPSPFLSSLSSSDPSLFPSLLSQQTKLFQTAFDRVNAAKEYSGGEAGGEEWDWKGRVRLEEEEEEEEDEEMDLDEKEKEKEKEEGERAWTEQETLGYLRTGRKPVL